MRTAVEVVARRGPGGTTVLPVVRSSGQLAVRRTGPATVHLVATAFGPLGGDEAEVRLVVEDGASLRVRTVAAAVALPARDGARPSVQRITAEVTGTLDLQPEPTVVAAGSHHRAELRVALAQEAGLVVTEQVRLGRAGERPGRWTGTTRIERCGRPVLHTTVDLGPGAPAWLAPVVPRAYVSTLHVTPGDARDDARGGVPSCGQAPAAGDGSAGVVTGADAVRLPLPGGWVITAWGDELHRVVAAAAAIERPVGMPA